MAEIFTFDIPPFIVGSYTARLIQADATYADNFTGLLAEATLELRCSRLGGFGRSILEVCPRGERLHRSLNEDESRIPARAKNSRLICKIIIDSSTEDEGLVVVQRLEFFFSLVENLWLAQVITGPIDVHIAVEIELLVLQTILYLTSSQATGNLIMK